MVEIKPLSDYLDGLLPALGVNKKRELLRLLYEVVKRAGVAPQTVLPVEKI